MQQGEAEDLEKLIYAELERTPENGAQFAKTMRRVMQREDQWAQWKADGATSFERDPGQVLSHQRPRKRRRLSLRNEEPNNKDAAQTNGWGLFTPSTARPPHNATPRAHHWGFRDGEILKLKPVLQSVGQWSASNICAWCHWRTQAALRCLSWVSSLNASCKLPYIQTVFSLWWTLTAMIC